MVDIITQPAERIEMADIEFHPLVRARLRQELLTHSNALFSAAPESVRVLQGRCEILRWVLGEEKPGSGRPALLSGILADEKQKAKAAEAKE
jgi:hypothetical protein